MTCAHLNTTPSLFILNYPTQIQFLAKTLPVMPPLFNLGVSLALSVCIIHLSLTCDISCVINCELLK